jgi:hypothetical protein
MKWTPNDKKEATIINIVSNGFFDVNFETFFSCFFKKSNQSFEIYIKKSTQTGGWWKRD